jgi:hypothetical protein
MENKRNQFSLRSPSRVPCRCLQGSYTVFIFRISEAWQQRRSTQVVTRPQTAGSVGSGGRPDGLGVCCAASRAFDLASSVFAADQESSAAADSESSCTGTESLLAVSVELLARATASPETPSKEQVLSRSPTVSQHAQLESHYHCTARSAAETQCD